MDGDAKKALTTMGDDELSNLTPEMCQHLGLAPAASVRVVAKLKAILDRQEKGEVCRYAA